MTYEDIHSMYINEKERELHKQWERYTDPTAVKDKKALSQVCRATNRHTVSFQNHSVCLNLPLSLYQEIQLFLQLTPDFLQKETLENLLR